MVQVLLAENLYLYSEVIEMLVYHEVNLVVIIAHLWIQMLRGPFR